MQYLFEPESTKWYIQSNQLSLTKISNEELFMSEWIFAKVNVATKQANDLR